MCFAHFILVYIAVKVVVNKIASLRNEEQKLPIQYKIDILSALKKAGYSTYRIRKEHIFSESTVQKFRCGEIVNADNIATICQLLHCQPGDLLEYADEPEESA